MRVDQRLSLRALTILLAVSIPGILPAEAQEPEPQSQLKLSSALTQPVLVELRSVERHSRVERRPSALIPMYGSLVVLQGLDIHSTRRGMSSGKTRESNPLMGSVVENGAAFIAVKAASTAGTIWASEKLWKRHPKKAVLFTVLVNATMAAVVAHNYRVAK